MTPTLSRARVATAAVTASVLALTIAPAQAGETRQWDNAGKFYTPKGHAEARVNVEFLSTRAVDIEGWVDDICPADGYAAKVRLSVNNGGMEQDFKNTQGCDKGRASFDPGPIVVPRNTELRRIVLSVCTYRYDEQGRFYGPGCADQIFYNWRLD